MCGIAGWLNFDRSPVSPVILQKMADMIRLDVPARRLDLLIDAAELAERMRLLPAPAVGPGRGYSLLYQRHVMQADEGADFDFLVAGADN